MSNRRRTKSPLQQMLSGQTSHVAKSPSTNTLPFSITKTNTKAPTASGSGGSSVTTAWRPSYYGKNDKYVNQQFSILENMRGKMDDYDYSSRLGQVIEDRYSIYRDQMERKYRDQRESYETALGLASTMAKDDKEGTVEIPKRPKVPGLGKGQGVVGLNKSWNRAIRNARSEDEAEGINRYYKYEMERVQSLQNSIRDQRSSVRNLTKDFNNDLKLAIARGDVDPDEVQRAVGKGNKGLAKEVAPDALSIMHGYGSEDKPDSVVKGPVSSSGFGFLDKVLPGKVTDIADKGLQKIWGESKDPLFWTIDKLSRPSFAVQNAGKAYYALDEDDESKGIMDVIGGGAAGKSLTDPLDEIVHNPSKLGKVTQGALEGFSGKEKTTFGDVIAANAKEDGVSDLNDNKRYQSFVGITGDVIMDPLNAVGAGVVTKPVKALQETRDLTKLSKEFAEHVESQAAPVGVRSPKVDRLTDPKEVYQMMVGNGKRPKNTTERKQHLFEVTRNVDDMLDLLQAPAETSTRAVKLDTLRDTLSARREALVSEYGDGVLTQEARESLEKDIQSGNATVEDLEHFNMTAGSLESDELIDLLTPAVYHNAELRKAAAVSKWAPGTSRESYELGDTATGQTVRSVNDSMDASDLDERVVTEGSTTNKSIAGALQERGRGRLIDEWENLGKKREQLAESVKLGNANQEDLDELDNFIKETKATASSRNKSLEDAIPSRLRNDPRLEGFDWEKARRKAYARAKQSVPDFEKNMQTAKRIQSGQKGSIKHYNNLIAKGKEENWPASQIAKYEGLRDRAIARKRFMEKPNDRAQATMLLRLAREYIAKSEGKVTLSNPEAANQLRTELAGFGDELSIEDAAEKKDLEQQLKSLEGPSNHPNKRVNFNDIPEAFKLEGGEINWGKISQHIPYRHQVQGFVLKDGAHSKDNWSRALRDTMQRNYEKNYNDLYSANSKIKSGKLSKADYNAEIKSMETRAARGAVNETKLSLNDGKLFENVYSDTLELMLPKKSLEDAMVQASNEKFAAKEAVLQAEKKLAAGDEIKTLDAQIKSLRRQQDKERARISKDVKKAREAQAVLRKRMKEEALFRVAEMELAGGVKNLSLNVMGEHLALPGSGAMMRAASEKANGLPLVKGTREAFAKAFKSPASQLTPEGQLIRARSVAHTPNIIEHHINRLRMTLGRIPEDKRKSIFNNMVNNDYAPKAGTDEAFDMIQQSFRDLLPYFNNSTPVGDSILTVKDINRYLPDEYKLDYGYVNKKGISTTQDIVRAVRTGKTIHKNDRGVYKDPYRMNWNLRVAVEQAQANKALEYMIGESFGIPRLTGKGLKNPSARARQFDEVLGKFENLGWKSIPELGNRHLFPPESHEDIRRLLKALEPRNITALGEHIDQATGIWKAATTIYNPGYWTRNGVGEVMSSWLGGVNGIKPYHWAKDTMKYARGDEEAIEAAASQFPLAKFMSNKTNAAKKTLFTTDGGHAISPELLWVLYQDQGLKTGFVNTEFSDRFSRVGTAIRDNAGVKGAAGLNDKLRSAGEWYEDYLRLAHFGDAVKKHKGSLEEAGAHAASEVRKYHFDYTDFTDFEKMTMLRAFPFYKWTRKAAPLMITMLFTKPGKMMVYPKVMTGLTTQDVSLDDNGYAPNYTNITPGWIQDLWAYKIAEGDEEGDPSTYGRMSTPQMDALQSVVSPGSTAYTLLNPLIKEPIEQTQEFVTGGGDNAPTLKGLFGAADTTNNEDMNFGLNSDDEYEGKGRLAHLMRTTPQGSFLSKFMDGTYEGDDSKRPSKNNIISFATGAGIYDAKDIPEKSKKAK